MSLYSEYLRERTDDKIIERDNGFVTYRYVNDGKSVYLIDIYTVPESRQSGIASALANLVANEARDIGCEEMLGTVVPSMHGSTTSMKVLLAYGFKLKNAGPDLIVFRKDL